jgi:hypothetical protein
MKKLFLVALLLSIPILIFSQCYDEAPGDENISYDATGQAKLTRFRAAKDKTTGFISTEYIGAENLLATVYIKKDKYCFAGDLGAFIDFKTTRMIGNYYLLLSTPKQEVKTL